MARIEISLNGETREVPSDTSLKSLLDIFSLSGQRVAIELNNRVVRRTEWSETVVCAEDKIEVVHFVGGG